MARTQYNPKTLEAIRPPWHVPANGKHDLLMSSRHLGVRFLESRRTCVISKHRKERVTFGKFECRASSFRNSSSYLAARKTETFGQLCAARALVQAGDLVLHSPLRTSSTLQIESGRRHGRVKWRHCPLAYTLLRTLWNPTTDWPPLNSVRMWRLFSYLQANHCIGRSGNL